MHEDTKTGMAGIFFIGGGGGGGGCLSFPSTVLILAFHAGVSINIHSFKPAL